MKDAIATFVHADGSITTIHYDDDGEHANPRNDDGNIATLVNLSDRTIDIDENEVYGLTDARERWDGGWGYGDFSCDQTAMVLRYLAMFHSNVLHYDGHWSAGDSYGFGYVTREAWEKWMGADYDGDTTPEQAFDQEVKVYGQWANGEVYGYVHQKGEPQKCQSCGQTIEPADNGSCWGFLGYESYRQIAEQATESPIVEER